MKQIGNGQNFTELDEQINSVHSGSYGRLCWDEPASTILYAMEYRNQEIQLADGSEMTIPDNVVLIFTENTLDPSNGLDLAIRRRMTFLKVLMSDRTVIRKWYRGFLSPSALKLILDVYDRIEDFKAVLCTHFKISFWLKAAL